MEEKKSQDRPVSEVKMLTTAQSFKTVDTVKTRDEEFDTGTRLIPAQPSGAGGSVVKNIQSIIVLFIYIYIYICI